MRKPWNPSHPPTSASCSSCFHTFRDHVKSETVAETDDSVGNGAIVVIGGDVVNEAPIDFQAIEWERRQVRER